MNDGRAAVAFWQIVARFSLSVRGKVLFLRMGSYIIRKTIKMRNYKLEIRNEKYEETGTY